MEDEQQQLFTVSMQWGQLPKSVTKFEGGGQSWACLKGIRKKREEERMSYFHLSERMKVRIGVGRYVKGWSISGKASRRR